MCAFPVRQWKHTPQVTWLSADTYSPSTTSRTALPVDYDRPAELVSERERRPHALRRPLVPLVDVEIRSADGGRFDPDEHLVLAGRRYGNLVEDEARARIALADRAHGLHAGDLATGERGSEPGYDRPSAGPFSAAADGEGADGALRQPARTAPAAGKRRRCDLRLPRRARRARAARARDAARARAHDATRAARSLRRRSPARRGGAREPAAARVPRRGRCGARAAAPRADPLPRRARRALRRRLAREERRRADAQPVLAPRAGGRGGLATSSSSFARRGRTHRHSWRSPRAARSGFRPS